MATNGLSTGIDASMNSFLNGYEAPGLLSGMSDEEISKVLLGHAAAAKAFFAGSEGWRQRLESGLFEYRHVMILTFKLRGSGASLQTQSFVRDDNDKLFFPNDFASLVDLARV